MPNGERGAALVEVLAAVAIVSVVGIAALELATGQVRSVATSRVREHELADQERLLTAYSLLERRDLNLRLGTSQVGPYAVSVERPRPNLFRIAVAAAPGGEASVLVTVVLRETVE